MPNRPPDAARKQAISNAVDFLRASQLTHGEFRTYAWSDDSHREICQLDSSPFVTALVLHSLRYLRDDRVGEMTTKALDMLCGEMEGRGLWRFWSSRHPLHRMLPPDLDDTCCISSVLRQYGRSVPPNRDFILANRNDKGIFYTWMAVRANAPADFVSEMEELVDRGAALILAFKGVLDTVDCVVNANVVLDLGESAETKPAIDYLIRIVSEEKQAECSPYYFDPLSFYYMVSRAFANGVKALGETRERIVERVISSQGADGSWGNALLTALAVCTLLNFANRGPGLERGIEYLMQIQRQDGSWEKIAMFLGREPYYGSEDLTTALCVQALQRTAKLH